MSETDICNSALRRLGEATILSLTDGTANANYCQQFYEVERNFLLRVYPWGFANKRVTLGRSTTVPDWEYSYLYALPNDYLKLLDVLDSDFEDIKIEGRFIATNLETVKIKYTAKITNTPEFDATFSEMLAVRLAAVLAYPLTKSNTVSQAMWKLYEEYEMDAFSADGQEGTPDALEDRSLIAIRI